ncbi:MAG: N(4)-(beta-N-acetylglucosaminyl)-L-asparaginase [Flavobacteriaceae bacterium]|nr:N(4)-(beta-N-acetylglucosaminyl)-L-asparaginase [Flavobacteriaceae bacterium]MCY4266532.1 N(4)-(beta-N-acetylglucosaminyl)-L-asparaginase [Flavobacteriaceae bacterium]MCY4299832.1 N(4)-(beta-N-acetylglucosaminyl)-L-asparaginase [Flavobacteriaceae bacterium]
MDRRHFVTSTTLGGGSLLVHPHLLANVSPTTKQVPSIENGFPLAISTWNNIEASQVAGENLEKNIDALTAAVQGVAVEEADKTNRTVGYGGAPDRSGKVTLDACVMNARGNCGSVMAVENIVHVAALAKDVMEKTPHVILSGNGARKFAIQQGYKVIDLLTDQSRRLWLEWLQKEHYKPVINAGHHDTIGMLCIDKSNDISGVCSTSGLAYKMEGRIGDSPIIGSGLFVDNEIGGAVATGLGEEVIKTVGSFLVVELIRQGFSPQESCQKAIERIVKGRKNLDFQVAYLAVNKKGDIGAYSIHKGFTYALYKKGQTLEIQSNSVY